MSHTDEEDVVEVEAPAIPASSILGQFSAALTEEIEESFKVLPVGAIAGFYAQYRALTDDEADAIRARARARAKLRARTTRGDDADPDGERASAALILAKACVQLMVPAEEGGGYEPMHERLARQGVDVPVLRYNRDLIDALAAAGPVPGGLTRDSDASEIVTTLHRRGESTEPLTNMAGIYEAWRGGISQQIIDEALG